MAYQKHVIKEAVTMALNVSKYLNIFDRSKWSESGDSHMIMTSLHQECWLKLPDCFSQWGMTAFGRD